MLKDVSRSSSVANMSSIQMEEMIVKLRKENKKLREENENESNCLEMWDGLLEKLASGEEFATPGDGLLLCYEETHKMLLERGKKSSAENEELKEDKLDLSQKIDILTKELEQCHTIISRHHEERKQNKKK